MRNVQIHPPHHSIRKSAGQIKPSNMDRADMSEDQYNTMSRVALSIFADCLNAGIGLNDALLAVYLSGLNHGSEAKGETHEQ